MTTVTTPIGAPIGAPAGETVTNVAAEAPPKPKRGRGAAGNSVFPAADLEAAKADAKVRGEEKFKAFTVKKDGMPDRFFVSNHRNAVQFHIMTKDGYVMISGDGSRPGRKPADPATQATNALDAMDAATRATILAKYLGNGNAAAAVKEMPPAAPRVDTTPAAEFDRKPAGATAPVSGQAQGKASGNAAAAGRKR